MAIFSNPADEGKPFLGPWVTDCSPDDVRDSFRDWEPEVQELLGVRVTPETHVFID